MKKNAWMILVATLLALLGTESVCADRAAWLTQNATPEFDPMAAAGEEEGVPVTEVDGEPVDSALLEARIKQQNDNGTDEKSDVRQHKPTRFGVGYEYRMRRNGRENRPDRPERVQRLDRPGRPDRPGR